MGGLVFSVPVIFYQLWSFVAPGLYPREKKLVLPFVFFSTLFFIGGALFAWRYERSRSFWAVWVEHVLWGWLVFTVGLGVFFFTGVANPSW